MQNAMITQLAARQTARKPKALPALLLALFALCCAALGRPIATASAEEPAGLAKLVGQYKYAGTRDEGIAIVEKAMDEALSDLNMVMRLLAKKAMAQHFSETVAIDGDAG